MMDHSTPTPTLVPIAEAARLLGLSRTTVYTLIRHGVLQTEELIPGCRRVLASSLAALVERRRASMSAHSSPLRARRAPAGITENPCNSA